MADPGAGAAIEYRDVLARAEHDQLAIGCEAVDTSPFGKRVCGFTRSGLQIPDVESLLVAGHHGRFTGATPIEVEAPAGIGFVTGQAHRLSSGRDVEHETL